MKSIPTIILLLKNIAALGPEILKAWRWFETTEFYLNMQISRMEKKARKQRFINNHPRLEAGVQGAHGLSFALFGIYASFVAFLWLVMLMLNFSVIISESPLGFILAFVSLWVIFLLGDDCFWEGLVAWDKAKEKWASIA